MALRRQVQHVRDAVVLNDAQDRVPLTKIHLLEVVFGMSHDGAHVVEASGVAETIQIHERRDLGTIDHVLNDVRADEAAAAGDKKIHFASSATTSFAPGVTGVSVVLPPGQRTMTWVAG